MKVSAFKQQFAIVSLYLKHQQKQFLKFMKSQVSFQVKNKQPTAENDSLRYQWSSKESYEGRRVWSLQRHYSFWLSPVLPPALHLTQLSFLSPLKRYLDISRPSTPVLDASGVLPSHLNFPCHCIECDCFPLTYLNHSPHLGWAVCVSLVHNHICI